MTENGCQGLALDGQFLLQRTKSRSPGCQTACQS